MLLGAAQTEIQVVGPEGVFGAAQRGMLRCFRNAFGCFYRLRREIIVLQNWLKG